MNERAALLKPQSNSHPTKEDTAILGPFEDSKPWTKKTKRPHIKTHGKIDFTSLSRLVADKWKTLPPEERKVYDAMASEDLKRYRHELNIYKRNVETFLIDAKKDTKQNDRGVAMFNPTQNIKPGEDDFVPEEVKSRPDNTSSIKNKSSHLPHGIASSSARSMLPYNANRSYPQILHPEDRFVSTSQRTLPESIVSSPLILTQQAATFSDERKVAHVAENNQASPSATDGNESMDVLDAMEEIESIALESLSYKSTIDDLGIVSTKLKNHENITSLAYE
eukprot:3864876-Ditylum_brightwellii.AAC.1